MDAKKAVLSALKTAGDWVLNNPNVTLGAVEKFLKKRTSESGDGELPTVEERVDLLGAAMLDVNRRLDGELKAVREQLRAMKIALCVMGAVLLTTIVAVVIAAIVR